MKFNKPEILATCKRLMHNGFRFVGMHGRCVVLRKGDFSVKINYLGHVISQAKRV